MVLKLACLSQVFLWLPKSFLLNLPNKPSMLSFKTQSCHKNIMQK